MKPLAALSLAGILFLTAFPALASSLQSSLLRKADLPMALKVQDAPVCFDGKSAAALEKPPIRAAALKAGLTEVCETSYATGLDSIESHAMSFKSRSGTAWGMSYVPSYAKREEPTGWKSERIKKIGDGSKAISHTVMSGGKVFLRTVYVYWHQGSRVGWVVSDGDKLTVDQVVALARVQAKRM